MRTFEALRKRLFPPPFTVLYDLRWMVPGQAGGIEQITRELIGAIGARDRANRYAILAPRAAFEGWRFPEGFRPRFHYSDAGETGPQDIHREGFDLVHSTSGFTHPDLQAQPAVVTMNDLQHVHHPEFFDPADWKNRDELYRDSTAKARHVICISEFTRRDMHGLYGVPLEKMTTIWPIPGESVRDPPSPAERARLLAGMGISAPFLFFPAHGWVHKNHARLVGAFARVAKDLPDRMLLLLAGRPFPADHPAALRIREAGMADRIIHLGYRTADEIRALLHECRALVFPSLFEGFGVPVADAIIAGRPVACSNATSLPEVAGEAALFFDPLDVDGIAAAILDIATQEALRDSLVGAAQRRRRVFSPRRVAEETLAVYDRTLRA